MTTAGFYKRENDDLLYGPHYVLNMAYELRDETHADYTYPVDGWYWFESEDDARSALLPSSDQTL